MKQYYIGKGNMPITITWKNISQIILLIIEFEQSKTEMQIDVCIGKSPDQNFNVDVTKVKGSKTNFRILPCIEFAGVKCANVRQIRTDIMIALTRISVLVLEVSEYVIVRIG